MVHGAIETRYAGCRFRSRLEARWAVFFDVLKIKWEYEPEGFETTWHDFEERHVDRWLPDFFLPEQRLWVEVKGSSEQVDSEYRYRLAHMLDWGSPVPYMENSWYGEGGLLLLGSVPPPSIHPAAHCVVQHHKGLILEYAKFVPGGVEITRQEYDHSCAFGDGLPPKANWDTLWFVGEIIDAPGEMVQAAYRRAREAQFEFGRQP